MKRTRRGCNRRGCSKLARKDYCSAACRAVAWRERHIPRCPSCDQPISLQVSAAGEPSQRVLGPPPDDDTPRLNAEYRGEGAEGE